jgi:hypothetical protein
MRVTIGGRELIHSFSLFVPSGNDAWIEFLAGTWNVRLQLVFEEDTENKEARFDLIGKGDHALLSVKNWSNSLPSAIEKPVSLGENDGRKIVFIFSGYAVGELKRFDLSFFWEK